MRKLLFIIALFLTRPASGQDKQLFKSMLNGTWAQASYLEDIMKTKSPYRSQNIAGIVELDIDTSKVNGDSLFVGAPSIHEGTSFFVYFHTGLTPTSLPIDIGDGEANKIYCELGYEIIGPDTFLVIYHYNRDKKILGKEKYIKIPKNSEGALQFMVNKILVSGTYDFTDSIGTLITVNFTDDGKVIGLNGFSTYYIATDFVAGPENNLDEIYMNFQAGKQTCFGYKLKKEALYLYEEESKDDTENLRLGKLKYKLVRKKLGPDPK